MHRERTAREWIDRLGLQPHPEGGFFRETYRSLERIPKECLPDAFAGDRAFCTAIHYLLERGQCSRFHRIQSDELWHFQDGGAFEICVLFPDGGMDRMRLGLDLDRDQRPVRIVPAGCWFAVRLLEDCPFGLAGCTVAPGFEFEEFELADLDLLLDRYPQHTGLIADFYPGRGSAKA